MANTPNYNLALPIIGGNRDVWGQLINGNTSSIDVLLEGIQTAFIGNNAPIQPSPLPAGTFWINTSASPWSYSVWDGSDWVLIGNIDPTLHKFIPINPFTGFQINVQIITNSGTYTPTLDMIQCFTELTGGGGGAGSGSGTSYGGGGGGAGYGKSIFTAAEIGASQAVVIGVAGLGSVGAGVGGNGGVSTFGSFITAPGGNGGGGSGFNVPGGNAGIATGANIINSGGSQGGGGLNGVQGSGGSSLLGIGGQVANGSSPGNNGTGYGSGGGACNMSQTAGNGAAGVCIITEYISG